jgi:hypothetical protein
MTNEKHAHLKQGHDGHKAGLDGKSFQEQKSDTREKLFGS